MKATGYFMMGLAFTIGMVLGLLLHLPSVSLPDPLADGAEGNNRPSVQARPMHRRSIKDVIVPNENIFEIHIIHDRDSDDEKLPPSSSALDLDAKERNDNNVDKPKTNITYNAATKHNTNDQQSAGDFKQFQPRKSDSQIENYGLKQAESDSFFQKSNSNKQGEGERENSNVNSNEGLDIESSQYAPIEHKSMEGNKNKLSQHEQSVDQEQYPPNNYESVIVNIQQQLPQEQNLAQASEKPTKFIDGQFFNRNNFSFEQAEHYGFKKLESVVNGIYWSDLLESIKPKFDQDTAQVWSSFARTSKIVKLEEGCGRMQNRLATFADNTKACVRYRQNTDQIQGELFSYYLSKILDINNIPPSALSMVSDPKTIKQWEPVSKDILLSHWNKDKVVILSQWVEQLGPAHIPEEFREDSRQLVPTADVLLRHNLAELLELVQWSDLIVFDYLTGNLDRVVNNMFNKQWNSLMMESPTHNLEKSTSNGLLVFFDNESGLFHSYRLLEKYSHFHESLLKSLCIFRRSTAKNIAKLHENKNAGEKLMDIYEKEEPHLNRWLPRLPMKNAQILQQRIEDVYLQIKSCEAKYGV